MVTRSRPTGGGLVPAAAEQAVLQQIRREGRRGKSLALIADDLNADRVPTKHGGRWYPATIRSVLATAEKYTHLTSAERPRPRSRRADGRVVYGSYTDARP